MLSIVLGMWNSDLDSPIKLNFFRVRLLSYIDNNNNGMQCCN